MKHKKFESWLRRHLFAVRTVLFIIALILLSVEAIVWGFDRRNDAENDILGVSFSIKYAEELGVDWQKNYLALLDELEVKHLRIMSYWDRIEPQDGSYDFTNLDWQFDQALAHDASVSLSLGQRQPRWPECHIPDWARQIDSQKYKRAVLDYIGVVVQRYRHHPSLVSYQLENEAKNRNFGDCSDTYDNSFLQQEYDVIKSFDEQHPVILNASNQSGIPLREPIGDKVGFSIYKRAHFDALGNTWPWSFWYVPENWHSLRGALVEGLHGSDTFVHELQAEPWGPEATVLLSEQEQDKTMDPEKLVDIVEFARSSGFDEIYLWGGEWWYWRLTEFNDKQLWQTASELFRESNRGILE